MHAFGLRLKKVSRLSGFLVVACLLLYLHHNPLLTLDRLERDMEQQPTPDMWWLKIEPVNISPGNEVGKSEDDLINDFKSQHSSSEDKLSLKDIEESPEAASAKKQDGVCSKGKYELDSDDLETELIHFLENYKAIKNKTGILVQNMAHQFAIWYIARQIRPTYVLEVGPWQHFGTWILHQAWPSAKTILVDKSKRRPVTYVDWEKNALLEHTYDSTRTDFASVDWASMIDPHKTLVYFYDGITHPERVAAAKAAGFRHLVFNHNSAKNGLAYFSLKLACEVLVKDTTIPLSEMTFPDPKSHKPRVITKSDIASVMKMWADIDVYFQFPSLWAQDKPSLRTVLPNIDELLPPPKTKQPYNNLCYVKLKKGG